MAGAQKRYGVEVIGSCRICGTTGYTEMHHIISQERCMKIGKDEWITNPGNIVELCKPCHNNTTASMVNAISRREEWKAESTFRTNVIIENGGDEPDRCWAMLKSGRRRCKKAARHEGLCNDHHKSIRLGLPPHVSPPK